MAGREPPSAAWQSDAGWQTLIRVLPLRNLSPDETRSYLNKRGIPEDHHQPSPEATLTAFHWHSVARRRSLCAAAGCRASFNWPSNQTSSRRCWSALCRKCPARRIAPRWKPARLVRVTTEALLGRDADDGRGHARAVRLAARPVVRRSPIGRPVPARSGARCTGRRSALAQSRLVCRASSARAPLLSSASAQTTTGLAQQRLLFDLIFLHRDNPMVRPFLEWQASGSASFETLCAGRSCLS